ncbi:hypothetical protein [Corynebacterium kalidii]
MHSDTKTCQGCNTTKDVGEFHRDQHKADGYQSRCKTCRANAQRAASRPQARRSAHPTPPDGAPTVLDRTGQGPWIWPVRGRFLVTTIKARPRDAGYQETKRCQIVGDYPTMDDALRGARARRKGVTHFRQNARTV